MLINISFLGALPWVCIHFFCPRAHKMELRAGTSGCTYILSRVLFFLAHFFSFDLFHLFFREHIRTPI